MEDISNWHILSVHEFFEKFPEKCADFKEYCAMLLNIFGSDNYFPYFSYNDLTTWEEMSNVIGDINIPVDDVKNYYELIGRLYGGFTYNIKYVDEDGIIIINSDESLRDFQSRDIPISEEIYTFWNQEDYEIFNNMIERNIDDLLSYANELKIIYNPRDTVWMLSGKIIREIMRRIISSIEYYPPQIGIMRRLESGKRTIGADHSTMFATFEEGYNTDYSIIGRVKAELDERKI